MFQKHTCNTIELLSLKFKCLLFPVVSLPSMTPHRPPPRAPPTAPPRAAAQRAPTCTCLRCYGPSRSYTVLLATRSYLLTLHKVESSAQNRFWNSMLIRFTTSKAPVLT